MKKIIGLLLLLAFTLSLFSFFGCFGYKSETKVEVLKTYPKEMAPAQIIKTDDKWVMLNNTYGESKYSISVGTELDSLIDVYSVDDVRIWYVDANQKAIVWCEKSDETYTYKMYDFETEEIIVISQRSIEEGFQAQNIGIYLDKVYYCLVDYERQEVSVFAYDIVLKETDVIHKCAFVEKKQPYSINLEDEYLNFVCAEQVKVLNLKENRTDFEVLLPDDVKYAYTASYDRINDTCAVYYADEDSEDIGIIKKGDVEISCHITFSENHYAYHEKVECHDGYIYWIFQANVSGYIVDNYCFADYNYLESLPLEIERTFEFYRKGKEIYLLRFNENAGGPCVELCKY